MHLLLHPSLDAVFGEVRVDGGRISGLSLTSAGKAATLPIWQRWNENGIGTLRSVRSDTKISAVLETVPFSSALAFDVLQNEAAHNGFVVLTIPEDRLDIYEEVKVWPMTERTRAQLLFMLKNLAAEDLPDWRGLWKDMATGALD